LNADIFGEKSVAADAEVIALAIDALRAFGFESNEFVVRISDRAAWNDFLDRMQVKPQRRPKFLALIDKLASDEVEAIEPQLKSFGMSMAQLVGFLADANVQWFEPLRKELDARGLSQFVEFNLRIVRGLPYYSGVIFEIFDSHRKLRAIAGGGRYDGLIHRLTDGMVSMSAVGFAMGDVVLAELIRETAAPSLQMHNESQWGLWSDIYIVIAKEERRDNALRIVQLLRDQYSPALHRNYRVNYPLVAEKVGKQFQSAEAVGARIAILIGDEWPDIKMKILASREERSLPREHLIESVHSIFKGAVRADRFIAEL